MILLQMQQKGQFMRENQRNFFAQRKKLTTVCVTLATVLLVLFCVVLVLPDNDVQPSQPPGTTGYIPDDQTAPVKELVIQDLTEQGNVMVVTTNYCTVSYSIAFSDIIGVKTETSKDCAKLNFCATIDGNEAALYTLLFGGEEGMPIGSVRVDDRVYTVTVLFHDGDGIQEEGMITFYAAQETFNDVIASLKKSDTFLEGNP